MPLRFEKLNQLTETLRSYIYRDPIPLATWQLCDNLPYGTPQPAASDPQWRDHQAGDLWGSQLTWAWLQTRTTIPDTFAGKPVALHLDMDLQFTQPGGRLLTTPEALVTVEGVNMIPQVINVIHPEILLAEQAPPSDITVTLQCFTGVTLGTDLRLRFTYADLVWIDREIEALYWDARTLLDTIAALPKNTPEHGRYLRALDEAFHQINWLNPPDEAFCASARAARAELQERVFSQPLDCENFAPRPVVHAMGHAHIDVAWLWPLRVTRGKAQRTFTTALALMEQFPAYTFTQTQPHLYKMVQEDDPELFERVKKGIQGGRWNATGATWVEPDTNMPNGESLVRQFLYGMRYFQQQLGVRPEVLWLPDVFGYSAALPQIMKLAGIDYFFTTKLSWNQYAKMPYDTFWWEGIDGTRILSQLATTSDGFRTPPLKAERATYNAKMTPSEMVDTWDRYQQKDANHHLIVSYGMGDGGGGPNRDMIERRARMENLAGLPQVWHSTAEDFFHALAETVPDDLPYWVGELYFQLHRGTYTTQARTKRNNRKTEVVLHDAEALAAIAYLLKTDYPHEAFSAAWETVLLNQFHDILPGSSISLVYEDADKDYAAAQQHAENAIDASLEVIARHIRYDEDSQGIAVFNTLSTTLGGSVEVTLPGEGPVEIAGPTGRLKPFQWIDEEARHALFIPNSIPAYGHKAYAVRPATQVISAQPEESAVTATPTRLENGSLRAEFDAKGNLTRVYDMENLRDVLQPGTIGNQLWAYVDRPHMWEAWDVEIYVEEQGWQLEPTSVELIESGPLRATLQVTYKFNKSEIVQRISLLAGQRTLTFETDVDWHEKHILLRTHFPLNVRAMNATYEIQFGTVERPTHNNTAWDIAQHEVPAQQWADMSEGDYGVSLLNDCKYGYSTRQNVLTMSLLRSTTYPDPTADEGQHTFTYALYPHVGDWRTGGTIAKARRLNHPLRTQEIPGGGTWLPVVFGLVQCQTPGVIIDTIKKAEDDDALIVRVYEAHGGRKTASLIFATPVQSAAEVNLLEEPIKAMDVMVDTLRFNLTPYQIRSFRVTLGDVLEHELG
ncbi:MAG: alpha-mannosidase [Anaerolineae bacterium]|nr:alpha-mannosidase [Anaerolineae bacterium]